MSITQAGERVALEDFAFEEVHHALGVLMYSVGSRLRRDGVLHDEATAAVVSNEIRRVLVDAAADPEAFSIQPGWLTSGNCFNG